MNCNKLFGTDGIRAQVNKWPLDKESVFKLGASIADWLHSCSSNEAAQPRIIIGKDTRQSCDYIESNFIKGLSTRDVEVIKLGVTPTPSTSYLIKKFDAQLAVMLSASHNPYDDNGIKFFSKDGLKLTHEQENRIEAIFFTKKIAPSESMPIINPNFAIAKFARRADRLNPIGFNLARRGNPNRISNAKFGIKDEAKKASKFYVEMLEGLLDGLELSGQNVVIDCSNGAVTPIARKIFRRKNFHLIHDKPTGKNINLNCGSLYPESCSRTVRRLKADMGFCFDGDGDRVIMIDKFGNMLDGDYTLAILSRYLLKAGRLPRRTVVCTQMSNLGLIRSLEEANIKVVKTDVGDKFVMQQMLKNGYNLGGEQSGHTIILDRSAAGDGLITCIEMIKAVCDSKKTIDELAKCMNKYPQVLINIAVEREKPLTQVTRLKALIEKYEARLSKEGRVYFRYSGTENLARIMIEGQDPDEINFMANDIAMVVYEELG